RGQQTSWSKQFEREQIDVLVRPGRLLRVLRRRSELRRIEYDHIECPRGVAKLAQLGEDVGVAPFGTRRIEGIGGDVLAGEGKRFGRAVDRQHRLCASGQRGDGEAAGVAKTIQYVATGCQRAHTLSVVALIEVEAGLLAMRDIDNEAETVLDDADLRRHRASHRPLARRQTFEGAYVDARAFVDRSATCRLGQCVDERVTPSLGSRCENLYHHDILVAIGDETREAIRLAMDQPARVVRAVEQFVAGADRGSDASSEKVRIDVFAWVEAPHASTNFRFGTPRGTGQRRSVRRVQKHSVACSWRSV